jgi:hypothetical protein
MKPTQTLNEIQSEKDLNLSAVEIGSTVNFDKGSTFSIHSDEEMTLL